MTLILKFFPELVLSLFGALVQKHLQIPLFFKLVFVKGCNLSFVDHFLKFLHSRWPIVQVVVNDLPVLVGVGLGCFLWQNGAELLLDGDHVPKAVSGDQVAVCFVSVISD